MGELTQLSRLNQAREWPDLWQRVLLCKLQATLFKENTSPAEYNAPGKMEQLRKERFVLNPSSKLGINSYTHQT